MKRILEFLCVPVLDGARVGVGNLNIRLMFEVKVYFWKLQFCLSWCYIWNEFGMNESVDEDGDLERVSVGRYGPETEI